MKKIMLAIAILAGNLASVIAYDYYRGSEKTPENCVKKLREFYSEDVKNLPNDETLIMVGMTIVCVQAKYDPIKAISILTDAAR